ncbi:MAG: DEAD/DEAH box helicase [Lachnospiraceae bacterium]|nr:DEAD/DEAH box helicase [Lachnospiraceae bacterium]
MADNFKSLGIGKNITDALALMGITEPTPVQLELIPAILAKQDVAAKSETGTGKTLAYLLPVLMMIEPDKRETQFIIITPTYELASQVYKEALKIIKASNIDAMAALIIGGAGIERQIEKLKDKPQIIIGSAGRILTLIKKRKISAHTVKTIILDEADRLLDDFNIESTKSVIKTTLKERNIISVSASIGSETVERMKKISKEPRFINIESGNLVLNNIKHYYITCEAREKTDTLRKVIKGLSPDKTLVFVNNNENISVIVEKLNFHGINADGTFGNAGSIERKVAIDNFISGKTKVLISSDLSSRGLDILDITHIINIDIPEDPVFYIHRAGRTGRNKKSGVVISIATEYEGKFILKISRKLNINVVHAQMSYGSLEPLSNKKYIKNNNYKGEKQWTKKKN